MKKLIAIFLGTMLGIGGIIFSELAWAPFSPGGGANITGQRFLAADGTVALPSYSLVNANTTGLYKYDNAGFGLSSQNVNVAYFGGSISLSSNIPLQWTNAIGNANTTTDVQLFRDGAIGTLAQRVGTTAQTFRVYNTFTDASNYERLKIGWSSNEIFSTTEAAGTGTIRNYVFGTNNGWWKVAGNTGHLLAYTDAQNDIGSPTANRPRDLYYTGTIAKGGNGTSVAQSTCKQGNATNAPGDANEDTLFTCNIGAGVLGANGVVRFQVVYSYTNNANAKTLRVRFGGSAVFAQARTTELNSVVDGQIQNRNATNSQSTNVHEDVAASGSNGVSITQPAIDTSVATTLTVTCQKTVAGDQCGMERVLVEVVP